MVQVMHADLVGKISDFGPLQFLRAEWWDGAPRIVLLRYSLDQHEEPLGLRLDLDKKAFLDNVANLVVDRAIRNHVQEIWKIVVEQQAGRRTSVVSPGNTA